MDLKAVRVYGQIFLSLSAYRRHSFCVDCYEIRSKTYSRMR
jgi:hypothetical protein